MIWVDTIPIVLYLETIKTQFYSLLKYLSLVFGRFSIEISSHYFSPPSNAINIKILFDVNHSPVKILNKTRKTYEKTWSVLVQTVLAIFFQVCMFRFCLLHVSRFPSKFVNFFSFKERVEKDKALFRSRDKPKRLKNFSPNHLTPKYEIFGQILHHNRDHQ
jgi:hypothetical protein